MPPVNREIEAARAAEKARRRRWRSFWAAIKTACAVVTVAFGLLLLLCSTVDLVFGSRTWITALLGVCWALAGMVCGVETFRGPLAMLGRANAADLARELDQ
ncbi:hypothetical protein [Caulobacter sp. UNC279MFTsu5.1]|uniref:hypothetical protein n=1 Tax=Caulobacter sp. UNC279MFTsu5.1 TaxID=1502775 RepID=UPI00036C3158|nr:hypothetical protein [Caulobacter sp. UNC279MFTsu5.1]SFK42232.1 hypothetical protein SAMN02799626_04258 [Caulobacter sp. UNC279MFTsu5.1]